MCKEILDEFDIVRRHADHIARAPSHHVGRSQAVEFFKERDAHLGQQPKGHVVRDPGLQPVKHPGDRRHNGKQNKQVHKRFTRLDGAHCQRPDHTDTGIGEHARDPKTKSHREPSFIGHDVLHEFTRGSKPAKPLRLDDGISRRELRLLAVGWHLLRFASTRGIDLDRTADAFFCLRRHQPVIHATLGHQFGMGALFDDGAFIQHQDAIGIDHAGKPVGKDQCGAPTHQSVERLLDDRFVLGIHRRQRFVEDQDRRISQNRSGDCNTLSLTAREPDTAFANHRVVALGQQRNKLMRVGRAAGLFEFLGCGIGLADLQVVGDRAMKKIGIQVHHRDLVTDISKTQAFKVVTTNLHHALIGIIKSQQQPYDRRLTRTAWANKAHPLTSRHAETQTLVRSASSARIGKTHPIKRHGGRKFLKRYRRFWLVDHRLGIHQLENRL